MPSTRPLRKVLTCRHGCFKGISLFTVFLCLCLALFFFSVLHGFTYAVTLNIVDERITRLKHETALDKREAGYTLTRQARKCVVAVVEETSNHPDLARAALETWVPDTLTTCDVIFVLPGDSAVKGGVLRAGLPVVVHGGGGFDGDVAAWLYLSAHHYDYMLLARAHTYVNADMLGDSLQALPEVPKGLFGLPNTTIAENSGGGGFSCVRHGYVIGRHTAAERGEELRLCQGNGTCAGVLESLSCEKPFFPIEHVEWEVTIDQGAMFTPAPGGAKIFPTRPPAAFFEALFVSPLNTPPELRNFYRQVTRGLRPTLPYNVSCAISDKATCQAVVPLYRKTCVNNPSHQLTLNHDYRPECPAPEAEDPTSFNIPAFVLSLDTPEATENFDTVRKLFQAARMKNINRFSATKGSAIYTPAVIEQMNTTLKAGELGYIDSMRRVFVYALQKNIPRIVVLDDDALPHKQFARKWAQIMREPRCGGHLWTSDRGGILLLGSTVWVTGSYPKWSKKYYGGWKMADADIRNATRNFGRVAGGPSMCFNANPQTMGSFAAVYHRAVYAAILEWIEEAQGKKPFDWVFGELGASGYIVRAAFPHLVVPDLTHKSTVDPTRGTNVPLQRRAQIHKWVYSRYCRDPGECAKGT